MREFDIHELIGLGVFSALFLLCAVLGFPEPEDSQAPRYAQQSEVWDR